MKLRRLRPASYTAKGSTLVLLFSSLVLQNFAAFTLDPTFGSGGKVTISFPDSSTGYSSRAQRVFVQPSGRIVVSGTFTNLSPDGYLGGIAFAAFTPNGSVDTAFGSGGTIRDWRPDGGTFFRDALMYPDGTTLRISYVLRLPAGASNIRTVRLNPDGSTDNVFASNVSIGSSGFFTPRPAQISIRSDGKILALINDNGGFFLYRLNADGTRDSTFGVNGVIAVNFNKISIPEDAAMEMLAFSDGKILIAGHVPPLNFTTGSK